MRRTEAELPDLSPGRPGLPAVSRPPVVRAAQAHESRPIDAEYRVVWTPWRVVRDYWWAFAYLGYCFALWAMAALIGWAL